MLRRSIGLAATFVLLAAGPGLAQSWETPTFFSPRPHDDLGAYIVKPDYGDWGVQGIWRQSAGINLGVRGGIGGRSGDRTVLIGAELFGPLSLEGTAPLSLYWVTGIGASIDGVTRLRIPVGVSVGVPLGSGGTMITPYVHPRVAFDVKTSETANGDETDTDIEIDIDIGADFEIADRWVLRFGYRLGSNDVLGIGFAFRVGRGVSVR